MDPRDRPRPLLDGATCTACSAPVPTGRIWILAQRDDDLVGWLDTLERSDRRRSIVDR